MGSCRQSTAPDQPHHISTLHSLTFFHQRLGKMSVEGLDSVPMIYTYNISQFRIKPDCRDPTLSRRLYGRIRGSPNIKPVMPSRFFREGGDAGAKPRGDPALDRPNRRSGCPAG